MCTRSGENWNFVYLTFILDFGILHILFNLYILFTAADTK